MRRVAVFVCSVGYIGFFPFAPGTVGSAAGLVVFLILRWSNATHLLVPVILASFVIGAALGGEAERALGGVDPGPVVIDEVMGMLMTLFLIPVNWVGMLIGFIVFRVMDIFKPFPARRLERLPGGLGVMADDAMAAIYANAVMQGLYYLVPRLVS